MTLLGKQGPSDPRAALQQIIEAYPRANRETWLRVFEAALEDDREFARASRRKVALRLLAEQMPRRRQSSPTLHNWTLTRHSNRGEFLNH